MCDKLQKFSHGTITQQEWSGYSAADNEDPDTASEPCAVAIEAFDKSGDSFNRLALHSY